MEFFGSDAPVKAGKDGVMIVRLPDGRASGDALILFDNDHDLEQALEKNRETMGSRYVELFRSSLKEFQMVFCCHNIFYAHIYVLFVCSYVLPSANMWK